MTDRVKGFTVALAHDMRDDDVAQIAAAISMIKGVSAVTPLLASPDDFIARERVRLELVEKLYAVLAEPR